jgi:DNA repair photolyase
MTKGLIYTPGGKAREYSPLAINIYKGCDHGCEYCYVTPMMTRFNDKYVHENVAERENYINALQKEATKKQKCEQVLLSFTTDPYNKLDDELELTRKTLDILQRNKIPTAILTKGGYRALRDMDIIEKFGKNIKVGASLTFYDEMKSAKIEPHAALPMERLDMLRQFHNNGIKTWASLEPVIDPAETMELISATAGFIDEYRVGKINHMEKNYPEINWHLFLKNVVKVLRISRRKFYVKEDLRKFANAFELKPEETNMDLYNLSWND